MPLSSRRLKWFRNTAIRTCGFLPSLRLAGDRSVKASHPRALQLSAGVPTSDSEGTTRAESRAKESSLGGVGGEGSEISQILPVIVIFMRTHSRRMYSTF